MLENIGKNSNILCETGNVLETKEIMGTIRGLLKTLEDRLDDANQENENLRSQIERLPRQEDYQTLNEGIEQILQICEKDIDEAKDELKQCKQELEAEKEKKEKLQGKLYELQNTLDEKEENEKNLKNDLKERKDEVSKLVAQNQQYEKKMEKMPALMQLYDAYDAIMEKKTRLTQGFIECIQKAMPMDDFDSFLCRALKRSFPIAFYLSLQSFIRSCSNSGQMFDGAMEEALHLSDQLLEELFSFGSEYFKEEELSRIGIEKGEPFEEEVCMYIGDEGGVYGNVVSVWLHGLKDEKEDRIYQSYVEGE